PPMGPGGPGAATAQCNLVTLPPAGYQVTVLVRDPARLPPEHRPARVVVGDVLNPPDVDKAIQRQDAVIIILGTRNDLSTTRPPGTGAPRPPPTPPAPPGTRAPRPPPQPPLLLHPDPSALPSRPHHHDVRGHQEHSGGHEGPRDTEAFLMWDLKKVPPKLLPVTEDHIRMHQILQESGLDCVSVMPPHIADDQPLTGDYAVMVNTSGGARVISKHDLGHFFLKCLTTAEYDGQNVYLSRTYPAV
uniref:NAD(P)-binding domain-containing protein n=1 Tax=Chelydra serpentina TaxID=8475 RepID=A0A8C3SZ35_CHESE